MTDSTTTRVCVINRAFQMILQLPKSADTYYPLCSERLILVRLRPNSELLGANGLIIAKTEEDIEYHFVDLNGKLAFDGQYFSYAESFSEGLAVVRPPRHIYNYSLDTPYGYIDHNGYFAIPPQFSQAQSFSEGLAAVRLPLETENVFERKWGYINRNGELVIPTQFNDARPFSAGLAVVMVDGRYGYIDHSGQLVIQPQFDDAEDFIHGRGLAVVSYGGYKGCIDRSGQYVLKPEFDDIQEHFGNIQTLVLVRMGATKVEDWELEGGQCTFMNSAGKLILPPFPYPEDSEQGDTAIGPYVDDTVQIKVGGKWGYLNADGQFIVEPAFDELGIFSEGLARFKQGECWGFLDSRGRVVIPAKFEMAGNFSQGLASVSQGGLWGFINSCGDFVVAPKYQNVRDFSEGLAAVKIQDAWGYVDQSGQLVIPCQFKWASEFEHGLALACNFDGKSSLIQPTGEWLISPDDFPGYGEFQNGAAEIYLD